MSFSEGFSTQGVPFITGSDGQVLTWSDAEGAWVAADVSGGSALTSVATSGSITGSGIESDPVRLKDDVTIQGDLFVHGTASISHLDTLYQQSLVIGDKYITVLSGANNHTTADGSGFLWGSGSTDGTTGDLGEVASILYDSGSDSLVAFPNFSTDGIFYGDGSGLTNLPTEFDHVLYVSVSGSDSDNGSFTNPLATISGALSYAKIKYATGQTVLIEVGPGSYPQNLTIDRYNTYIKSAVTRYEQRAVTVTGKTTISAAGSLLSFDIVGIEGIFFNVNSTDPAVNVSGTTQTTVYFKDCYLSNSNKETLKVQGITSTNGKVVLKNSYFYNNQGTSNIINVAGGYIKADTIEVSYPSSVTAGTASAINLYGDSVFVADRLLVEMPNKVTGSSITSNATSYITNASLSSSLTAPSGTIYVGSGKFAFIYNTILQNNYTIKGENAGAVAYYSGLTSVLAQSAFSTITSVPLYSRLGNVAVTSVSASSGLTGSLNGTASYALDSAKLGGVTSSFYARIDAENTFLENQVFIKNISIGPLPGGTAGKLILQDGASIQITQAGGITTDTGNIKTTSGYLSGSGQGITGLTGSNWDGSTSKFISDVRNQLSGGTGINYNKTTGEITAVAFQGVETTGSITGSGLSDNRIKLKNSVGLLAMNQL